MSGVKTFCLGIYRGMWSITAVWEEDGDVPCVTPSAPALWAGLAKRKLAALHLCVLQELE